ncbi:MAG: hypothetical protein KF745_04020 [Phycisphaeraceae bacterium]|nr:hypothetical protein [Phycisphaeraceae bacterium]
MSSIPSNLSRVPNLLASQIYYTNLNRSNLSMLHLQEQLASARSVNRPSDDSVKAASILALDDILERSEQRVRNLDSASNSLNLLDTSIGEANDLVLQAKDVAASQIGATSDAATRRNQAIVIDSVIRQLSSLANRETNGLYLFGGATPTQAPLSEFLGGYRYTARGDGLYTDLGASIRVPVTLGGSSTIGQTSARLRSTTDLNPSLTPQTRIADLGGARGLGVSLSQLSFSFNGGPAATVDLSTADSVQNVADSLTAAIRQYETDHSVTILGPGGISLVGGSLAIDVVPAGSGPNPTLTFTDIGVGSVAQDLGLSAAPFSATSPTGSDLNPRLSLLTPLSAVPGLALPLGSINLRFTGPNTSSLSTVDLSSAQTIGDIRNLIQTGAPGVRVEINAAGTGIDLFNEVSGPRLSVEEVPPPAGGTTATQLGIRSYSLATALSDFNDGRGVRIVDGATNPVTGLPDPAANVDFTIRLGDGSSFSVDLRPQDLTDVQSVIARINAEAAAAVTAGQIPPGSFSAGLTNGQNGIAFFDPLNLGAITVTRQNNSPAAEDLGLVGGTYDSASATYLAQDRASVRVNNLFSTLIDLRDALTRDDSNGIAIAGTQLDAAVESLASTRALVGVYANRIERAKERQEDQRVLDEKTRSELRDLDYTDAAIRFSLLQTQLQAGQQSASQVLTRSLLDFLG